MCVVDFYLELQIKNTHLINVLTHVVFHKVGALDRHPLCR